MAVPLLHDQVEGHFKGAMSQSSLPVLRPGDQIKTPYGVIETVVQVKGNRVVTNESRRLGMDYPLAKVKRLGSSVG